MHTTVQTLPPTATDRCHDARSLCLRLVCQSARKTSPQNGQSRTMPVTFTSVPQFGQGMNFDGSGVGVFFMTLCHE